MNELKIGASLSSSLERVFICGKFLFWSSVSFFLPDSQPPLPQPDRSDVLPYRLKCGFPPHLRVDFFLLFVFFGFSFFSFSRVSRFDGEMERDSVYLRCPYFSCSLVAFVWLCMLVLALLCSKFVLIASFCFGRIRGASSPLLFWILKPYF